MKLGLILGTGGAKYSIDMDFIKEAERLGYDSVWTSEAWGSDAISPAAWILGQTSKIKVGTGIIQMSARTPSCAAMTAMTLQQLSGNRFILGIGPSGPQVIEGWHGQPYGKPLTRTREYIQIVRDILKREAPLTHDGECYQIPYGGPGATGLGKPLRSVLHGDPSLRIVTGTIAPAGVRTSAEVADGMIPVFMSADTPGIFDEDLAKGFAKAGGGKSVDDFAVTPFIRVNINDDLDKARQPVRENLALYIGGMGAREKNFYNQIFRRYGYEREADAIQELFLSGRKDEAEAAIPDRYLEQACLVGDEHFVRDRLQALKASGVTTLNVSLVGDERAERVRQCDRLRELVETL